jgi:integrase
MTSRTIKIDIHNYDKQYESTRRSVRNADISERNKELILDFERTCFLKEALSKPRRIKLMGALIILARDYARRDFDKMDRKVIEEVILKIDTREDYSVWTKQSYRTIIKKFLKWLHQGDNYKTIHGYPEIVSWINTNVKKKDKPKVQASDLLTELEVKRLMDVAEHPRDKAFVSMIYELGARIGEIGNLRIKDVTRDDHSYIVDLRGKTGHRTPRIVISDPYVTAWLNIHPMKDDTHSPLWVLMGNRDKCRPMEYGTFRKLILRLRKKARIKKRLYPHLFRHTRVTHLLTNKQINEAQAKVYFGWVPSSTMLSEYSHLISSDVNNAILEIHGIRTSESKESLLKPRQCPRCSTINAKDARFCQKCSSILDVNAALDLDQQRRSGDELMAKLMKDPEIMQTIVKRIAEMGLRDKLLKDISRGEI